MLWVSIWFVSYLILLFLLSEYVYPFEQQGDNLWLAGKGALVGSLFSVGIAYRSRQIALGTDARDNATDGLVRLGIGVIAGCVALLLLTSGFAPNLVIGSTTLTAGTINWHAVLMIGFVAGFLERLVPNMLDKAGTDLSPPSSKDVSQSARFTQRLIPDDAPDIPALKSPPAVLLPIVPTGGPDPKPTPDPAVRGTTSAVDRLREIREDLHTTRRMIGALNGLVSNSELAFSANALTGSLDQMLETIDVALGVGASAPAVADLADAVSQLLRQLGNVGLPCVLGVVMSVLEGSMKVPAAEPG